MGEGRFEMGKWRWENLGGVFREKGRKT